MSKYSPSCRLLIRVERSCPSSPLQSFRSSLRNYWEQLSWNLNLKFLWHITLYVNFLKKFVALNLKLCRVIYILSNPYESESWTGFKGLPQIFISHSIQIQWPYNLYGQRALDVQFHLKFVSSNYNVCRRSRMLLRINSRGFSTKSDFG